MTVLIITHSQDNASVERVIQIIKEKREKVFRFNTDDFPTQTKLDLNYEHDHEKLRLITKDEQLNLRDVSAVWYRRVAIGKNTPVTMEQQLRNASIEESRVTIRGMIASLEAFHLDPYINIERAKNKQLQLQISKKIGLKIPRTLITNNPQAVKNFFKQCQDKIVTKMLSSFTIYEKGQEQVVFTNPVVAEDLESLEGLQYCPMTFQETITKSLELRTTIVGKKVFTAAIDSQKLEKSRYDWRRQGIALMKDWQPHKLPKNIEEKLLKLTENLGLNYGAIDLILTPEGEYVFLEINPVGEFFWLDLYTELPISLAIAELLLNQKNYPNQG